MKFEDLSPQRAQRKNRESVFVLPCSSSVPSKPALSVAEGSSVVKRLDVWRPMNGEQL
jgi:hypothetical protein